MCWMGLKLAPPTSPPRRIPRQPRPQRRRVQHLRRPQRRHHRKPGQRRPLLHLHGPLPRHLPRRPHDRRRQRRLHERQRPRQARLQPHPPRHLPRRMFRVPAPGKMRAQHRRLRRPHPPFHLRLRRPLRRRPPHLPRPSQPHRPGHWWWCRPGALRRLGLSRKVAPFRSTLGPKPPLLSSAMAIG